MLPTLGDNTDFTKIIAHKVIIHKSMMKARENSSEVLAIGEPVHIQNTITRLWDETGDIDGIRQHGKSYYLQCDVGGVPGLRNGRHIRGAKIANPLKVPLSLGEMSALRSAWLLSTSRTKVECN